MGSMLYQKFELVVENELTADPDDDGAGQSGPNPGQGTAAERELWNNPEKREQIQKPYQ